MLTKGIFAEEIPGHSAIETKADQRIPSRRPKTSWVLSPSRYISGKSLIPGPRKPKPAVFLKHAHSKHFKKISKVRFQRIGITATMTNKKEAAILMNATSDR